jgi:DNA-binding XRE family transcriptional regulator
MMRRAVADWSAGVLAVAVLALGGLIVVKPAIDNWDELYRADPFATQITTERVDRDRAGKRTETKVTTRWASDSFVERGLGNSGLLLVRVALVALAAFLVAAVLHRALLGSYGLRSGAGGRTATSGSPAAPEGPGRRPDGRQRTTAAARNGVNGAEEEAGGSLVPVIARLVAVRREELGLSQRELAKRAGISHTVVSRIEGGDYSPGRKTLDRLAEALDVRG